MEHIFKVEINDIPTKTEVYEQIQYAQKIMQRNIAGLSDTLNDRVNRLERELNALRSNISNAARAGEFFVPLSTIKDVFHQVNKGQKIRAIKALREGVPGMGLKEAKQYVESLLAVAAPLDGNDDFFNEPPY